MWRQVQTYIVVTVITLLVWILAESEGVRTESLRVDVVLAADAEGRRILEIEPEDPFTGSVTLRLEGATARIDALTRELRHAIRLVPPMPGLPAEPGRHRVDLRSVLRAYPLIRDSGATLTDVDPQFVEVRIDEIVTREAKVVVRVPDNSIVGPATATPPTVTLRLPSTLAAALPGQVELAAVISVGTLAALPEGKFATIPNVPLSIPPELRAGGGTVFIQVDPPAVSVSLTPRAREARLTIPAVPVQFVIPQSEYLRWDLSLADSDASVADVTVLGAVELVEQVGKTITVVALVQPTFQELENAHRTGQPLVKGVVFATIPPSPLRFDAQDRTVTIRVRSRGSGDPAPPPDAP